MKSRVAVLWSKLADGLTIRKILLIMLGAMICSFGIHNIHQRTNITEGGVIGLMLLVEHWLKISPAYITPILDIACYLLAFKFLGGSFIKISVISTFFVSGFYKVWEMFPPMLPNLSEYPLIAAVVGLLLSLTYIPVLRIVFSLVTVTISSYLIDWIREYKSPESSQKTPQLGKVSER